MARHISEGVLNHPGPVKPPEHLSLMNDPLVQSKLPLSFRVSDE